MTMHVRNIVPVYGKKKKNWEGKTQKGMIGMAL